MSDESMAVFQWRGSQSDKYAGYYPKTDADERMVFWDDLLLGDSLPPLDKWQAPVLSQYSGEGPNFRKPKKTGNATRAGDKLFIDECVRDGLAETFESDALLYPVILEDMPGKNHYMVVPQVILGFDALDHAHTEFLYRGNGTVYGLRKWAFRPEAVGDHDLFALRELTSQYFVSRRFVDRVLECKFKGFQFDSSYMDKKIQT